MKSKPLGFDFLSPRLQRRIKSNAEFAATDRLARMEYNQTEIVELHRLARSDSATLARANREMMEGSFEQLGDDLRAGLGEISASLQGMENYLGQLNETANAQLSVLENIADMLFHIATGRDYNATLRQRAADAQEAQRQQQIARDDVEALDLLRAALTETNVSERKMQMEQVEHFLRLAMTLPSVSAQAAMELGTFLLARDGNLDGAKECYEHSLCRISRWSPQWVYVSRLIANVDARNDAPDLALQRMNEIIRYGGQLDRFSDEVRAINRLEDWEARFARLCVLIEKIQNLGGHSGNTLAGIEAELNVQKKVNALERLEREEPALVETFGRAHPDPAVLYDCARFASLCGKESEAAGAIRSRLDLFNDDLAARRVFLLQLQATPEFTP